MPLGREGRAGARPVAERIANLVQRERRRRDQDEPPTLDCGTKAPVRHPAIVPPRRTDDDGCGAVAALAVAYPMGVC